MDKIISRIEKVRNGDMNAFGELIDEYQQSIYGYLYRMLLNHQDAEDLTQETFTVAYLKINQLKTNDAFKGWLFKIAYSQAQQYFRKKKKNVILFEKLKENHHVDVETSSDLELLECLKEHLTSYELTLFILRVVEEMSYNELSCCLGKKPSTIRKQYERILKKLREKIKNVEEVFANEA